MTSVYVVLMTQTLLMLSNSVLVCQDCDLPEQSTVHVVLPPAGTERRLEQVLQRRLSRGVDSLTRLDLSASRLLTTSTGLAAILQNEDSDVRSGTQRWDLKVWARDWRHVRVHIHSRVTLL